MSQAELPTETTVLDIPSPLIMRDDDTLKRQKLQPRFHLTTHWHGVSPNALGRYYAFFKTFPAPIGPRSVESISSLPVWRSHGRDRDAARIRTRELQCQLLGNRGRGIIRLPGHTFGIGDIGLDFRIPEHRRAGVSTSLFSISNGYAMSDARRAAAGHQYTYRWNYLLVILSCMVSASLAATSRKLTRPHS